MGIIIAIGLLILLLFLYRERKRMKEQPKSRSWLGWVWAFLVFFIFIILRPDISSSLFFGWIGFPLRVLPDIEFNWEAIMLGVGTLALLGVGGHFFLNWLYRYWGNTETELLDSQTPPRLWRPRWTVAVLLVFVLMFATGMGFTGVVRQVQTLKNLPRLFQPYWIPYEVRAKSHLEKFYDVCAQHWQEKGPESQCNEEVAESESDFISHRSESVTVTGSGDQSSFSGMAYHKFGRKLFVVNASGNIEEFKKPNILR